MQQQQGGKGDGTAVLHYGKCSTLKAKDMKAK
jgi:hypothetical protein